MNRNCPYPRCDFRGTQEAVDEHLANIGTDPDHDWSSMSTHYITVATRASQTIDAYLYSHTRIIASGSTDGGYWVSGETPPPMYNGLVLATTADTEQEAVRLAQYQADRLASGLHAAATFDSREAAEAHLREVFGITVTDLERESRS